MSPRARAKRPADGPVEAGDDARPTARSGRKRSAPASGDRRLSSDGQRPAPEGAGAPEGATSRSAHGESDGRRDGESDGGARGAGIRTVIAEARAQFLELTGRPTEAVTSVARHDGGWRLSVEVVELERIPASTSILGAYDVLVDGDGNLMEYSRVGRYHRNQAGEAD